MFSHIVRQWFTRSFLVAESSFFLKGKKKSKGSLHVLCYPLHLFLQGIRSFSSASWLLEVNHPFLLGAGWLWGQGRGDEPNPGFPTGQGSIEKSRGVTNAPAFSTLEKEKLQCKQRSPKITWMDGVCNSMKHKDVNIILYIPSCCHFSKSYLLTTVSIPHRPHTLRCKITFRQWLTASISPNG